MKFSKSIIDKFKYEGREYAPGQFTQDIRWDEAFGVRVNPNGSKTFVIKFRVRGRQSIKAIGKYGAMTYEQARKDAKIKLGTAASNKDPFLEKDKGRTGKGFSDLAKEHLLFHQSLPVEQQKKSLFEDERRINRILIPEWGTRKLSSFNQADISKLHHKITICSPASGKPAPYEANRTIELVSVLFNEAIQWGYFSDKNPADGVRVNTERKRDRWATKDEVSRIWNALNFEPNQYAAFAIKLYLLLGVRKNELLKAKWEHINWELQELRLPDTKSKRIHHVPLSSAALSILKSIPRQEQNPFILCGHIVGQPLVNISKPWIRILKDADVKELRLHDLRRTVGSWLAQNGRSLHLIGRVLNHTNASTTQVYARFGEEHVREALEDHGQRILGAVQ